MTTKFDNFKVALEKLCEEHKVILDSGYDVLTVWDNPYGPDDPVCPVIYDGIQDETGIWELNYGPNAEAKWVETL